MLVAGDISFGMIRQTHQRANADTVCFVNLDARRLPFPDSSFDIVLANHMLYHVPDIAGTLAEIKRILRPKGCLFAATNSISTMEEFDTLARRACTLLGFPRQQFTHPHYRFTLENGTVQLAQHFRAVARYDAPSALHFPDVQPVMAYLNSMRALREPMLPRDVSWDEYMLVIEKQIRRLIRRDGELRVHKLAGVLIATNGGGFAKMYLEQLNSDDTTQDA
jgi:SAM-dependent methyltransferase